MEFILIFFIKPDICKNLNKRLCPSWLMQLKKKNICCQQCASDNFVVKKKRSDKKKFNKDVMFKESVNISQILPMLIPIYNISALHNRRRPKLVQVKIFAGQNWRRSKLVQVKIDAGRNWRRSKLTQVKIGAGQNLRRSKFVQVKIGAEKNEPTWLYLALIKKNSCAKLIVLHLMVTRYIGNMIVFLRCHNAHLSITITSKLPALNHNKILYYCNCHATISSSIHTFASFFS